MNMGYNRGELAAVGPGRYAGETSLPVCVSGSMAWVATVIVEGDASVLRCPFALRRGTLRLARACPAAPPSGVLPS
ncbi:MAG: hypothetical protein IPI44_24520 [Sulfuritalea sp.]|nr:hypothetical protein [Sulfuritalea sp.]